MPHTKESLPSFLADSITTYFVNLGMTPQDEIEFELLKGFLSQLESDSAFNESVKSLEYSKITLESARKKFLKKDFFIFASRFLDHTKLQDIVFNFLVDKGFALENIKVSKNLLTKNLDMVVGTASFQEIRVNMALFAWKKTFNESVVKYPCSVLLKIED